MAKNLKINIKNTQIAQAINLGGLKNKLSKKIEESEEETTKANAETVKHQKTPSAEENKEEQPQRIKARSKSAFSEPSETKSKLEAQETDELTTLEQKIFSEKEESKHPIVKEPATPKNKTSEELRKEIFAEELKEQQEGKVSPSVFKEDLPAPIVQQHISNKLENVAPAPEKAEPKVAKQEKHPEPSLPKHEEKSFEKKKPPVFSAPPVKLGPTGRHVKDLYQPRPPSPQPTSKPQTGDHRQSADRSSQKPQEDRRPKPKEPGFVAKLPIDDDAEAKKKTAKFKEFKDIKPARKQESGRFDARDRQGLRVSDDDQVWRKKRKQHHRIQEEDTTIRPTQLKIRLPITIKDLASEMKLKASQLIAKMFLQGVVSTLNDVLDDETTIQLLGQEFGCEISIDTTEEERIRITAKSISEEISHSNQEEWSIRPPIVAFMGHVDHGKTSLIDAIRKSNRVSGEAGAITQHIGAFRCSTPVGDLTILDTPGHEAFSAMRARGANVTDIIVLVVAGDEGIKLQTVEAINHAKAGNVTIVVAINKSDKPNFNPETVYRQLSENELLPEAWGGQTITVNCSAATGEGIQSLLEMLALQAEVLELNANPKMRARGSVIESEMHKGMGSVATVLVQNGTLRVGDSLVFDTEWGKVKTMRDEFNRELKEAGPSTPVEVTGLSGLPEAGQEFIVVKNEREAREIAEARQTGKKQFNLQQPKKLSMENIFQQASETQKKTLNVILRADVQGSLEAIKVALEKIKSNKAELNIIFSGVGEVSESDVQLAAASKAVIIGFHTQVENHAESIYKQLGIQVHLHDIIYHAIDNVKELMLALLDKIAIETEKGKAEVRALFKSSQVGQIAGCQVIEGSIHRNHHVRVRRDKDVVWKGSISSLKRVKEDVREVQKGLECGIVLNNCTNIQEGDIIESYEITYITQEL